jgi:hypothetical protein
MEINTTQIVMLMTLTDEGLYHPIFVDTTPVTTDQPTIDSLDLENWAVEKHSMGATIADIVHFDTIALAKAYARRILGYVKGAK